MENKKINVGDRVYHNIYKEGDVEDIDIHFNPELVSVCFDNYDCILDNPIQVVPVWTLRKII